MFLFEYIKVNKKGGRVKRDRGLEPLKLHDSRTHYLCLSRTI